MLSERGIVRVVAFRDGEDGKLKNKEERGKVTTRISNKAMRDLITT